MDIALNYIETGEGFPLVLLHGNGEDHTYFKRQMEPFSQRYRVIALDTRGHGGSPRGSAPFTLDQFAGDLKEFLDRKGITRCHLLGFSDGGNIALLFALKYPQYVEKLVLNGANLRPSGVKPLGGEAFYPAPHCGGVVRLRGVRPVQQAGEGQLGDAQSHGDPAPYQAPGTGEADHTHSGHRRGERYDSREAYPAHRRLPSQQ